MRLIWIERLRGNQAKPVTGTLISTARCKSNGREHFPPAPCQTTAIAAPPRRLHRRHPAKLRTARPNTDSIVETRSGYQHNVEERSLTERLEAPWSTHGTRRVKVGGDEFRAFGRTTERNNSRQWSPHADERARHLTGHQSAIQGWVYGGGSLPFHECSNGGGGGAFPGKRSSRENEARQEWITRAHYQVIYPLARSIALATFTAEATWTRRSSFCAESAGRRLSWRSGPTCKRWGWRGLRQERGYPTGPSCRHQRTSGLRGMGMEMGRERKIGEVGQNEGSRPRRHVFFFSIIFYFCSPFISNSI
jgi:hypothetical protein